MKKCLVVLSGGMDSTTTLHKAIEDFEEVEAISFFYEQKHKKELDCARKTCQKLQINLKEVNLSYLSEIVNSALTSKELEIPEGHYEDENMKQTVVPFRNMIFFSNALAYASTIKASHVGLGVHSGDHAIYPDCRPEFWNVMQTAGKIGDWTSIDIYNPFQNLSKIEIVKEGIKMGVDYANTWTCYKGEKLPCGECGSCVERQEAFYKNGINDPLEYI